MVETAVAAGAPAACRERDVGWACPSRAFPRAFPKSGGNSRLHCVNCGDRGHIFKNCNQPVTSYGVILVHDRRILMAQRRDSYSFVEFVRGKYNIANVQYLIGMFCGMTPSELGLVRRKDFACLWRRVWSGRSRRVSESAAAERKFSQLLAGTVIRRSGGGKLCLDLDFLLANSQSCCPEPEWGFPKGRRSLASESGITCAMRELLEETAVDSSSVMVLKSKPFEQIFTADNGVRYRHILFLANARPPIPNIIACPRELSRACFFHIDDVFQLHGMRAPETHALLHRIRKELVRADEGAGKACGEKHVPDAHTGAPFKLPPGVRCGNYRFFSEGSVKDHLACSS
jgi:8-oxo-dGTP pyrophosphatase MutT (NUDIX family)